MARAKIEDVPHVIPFWPLSLLDSYGFGNRRKAMPCTKFLKRLFLNSEYRDASGTRRMKTVIVTALILCLCFAQKGLTEQIAPDRPGLANGTGIVPTGTLQLESGYRFSRVGQGKQHTLGEVLLRIAPCPKMELRVGVNSYLFTRSPGSDDSGLGDGSVGLKVKLFEGSEGMESLNISTILATTLPTGSEIYRENKLQPSAELILGWNLSERVGIGTDFSYTLASLGGDQYNQFAGGVSLGFSLSGRTACFLEYYGVAVESGYGENISYFDGGFTYLISDNCQVDIHSGVGLSDEDPNYFVGVGLCYNFGLNK